jgi:hypothetical protein
MLKIRCSESIHQRAASGEDAAQCRHGADRRHPARAPGSYVYVINADNRVSVRPVNIGPTDVPNGSGQFGR